MRRRDFITLLGGAAAAWPLAARAQQGDRVRSIGVLMVGNEADPQRKGWLLAFAQALAALGWKEGGNLRMDVRWAGDTADRIPMLSGELVGLQPDLIPATGTPATAALQHATHTIPIIFVLVADPVRDRFVASLARPAGNITGFGDPETAIVGKWLELLAQVAPTIKRAAMIFNPDTAPYAKLYYLPLFEDLQDEWERRGKEVLRELSALELAKVMSIVTRPFVSRLAGSISEIEGSLPEDLEGLVERARLEHGPKAAAIMRRYIKEVCSQQGGE